jgi:hypothetical protein
MKPSYATTVNAGEFYSKLGTIECPKCRLSFTADAPPDVFMASDIAADKCPYCDTYVLINMAGPDPVYIEGYDDGGSLDARVQELIGQAKVSR